MALRTEQKNLDIYGDKPIPWSRARRQLEAAMRAKAKSRQGTYWLATSRLDGRPHLTAVGALWVDDRFYFASGPGTRKSRDLAHDPHCVISVSLRDLDLVVEGTARRVTDQKTLRRLARRYVAQGWPARAADGAITAEFSAPSAGPPPWHLYSVMPRTAFGVATAKPYGATRWRFKGPQSSAGAREKRAAAGPAASSQDGTQVTSRRRPPEGESVGLRDASGWRARRARSFPNRHAPDAVPGWRRSKTDAASSMMEPERSVESV